VRSKLPTVAAVIFLGVLGALLWWAADESAAAPAAKLRFQTDGFLSADFVKKVIADGPEGFARDVRAIKADLESDNQVLAADVRRRGDGSLDIGLRERLAVAKIASQAAKGAPIQVRLVAADGQTFAGVGYPEQAVRRPARDPGLPRDRRGRQLLIEGIEIAAPFLLTVRTKLTRHLYKQWSAVSLRDCFGAQEDSPGSNLRVTVRPGTQPLDRPALVEIVFSTANWRSELALLGRINVDELLRRPGTTSSAYVLKDVDPEPHQRRLARPRTPPRPRHFRRSRSSPMTPKPLPSLIAVIDIGTHKTASLLGQVIDGKARMLSF
jgi:hypothetical protein